MSKLFVTFPNFANASNHWAFKANYSQMMRSRLMRVGFRNRLSQKSGTTCIYIIFMWGRVQEISLKKETRCMWRWEQAVQNYERAIAFKQNARLTVHKKQTNKQAEGFIAKTVCRRLVTTSVHVRFAVQKAAVAHVFIRVLQLFHSAITAPYSFIHLKLMVSHRSKSKRP